MNTEGMTALRPSEHVVRLLRPFFLKRAALDDAVGALTRAQYVETRERQGEQRRIWWLWEQASPAELYRGEVLDHVEAFLFGQDPAACRYLRVPAETADFWFKRGGRFAREIPREGDRPATEVPRHFEVRLGPSGIELFLSPHGVGVLSIAFEATACADEWFVRELDYRLCQIRPFTAYPFRLPFAEAIQTPTPSDAPLERRLGAPGGTWTVAELSDRLIAPVQGLDHRWVQGQCSVYSVTRFGSDVPFSGRDIEGLRAFLYASAHIEEYHHVGSLKITEALLNPRHWAAVGSLGAAHLVADQDPPHPFDAQRVHGVLFTYFVPYLLSLLQRLTLQRLLDEARRQVVAGTAESAGDEQGPRGLEALRGLHWQMLALNVNGYFTEISSREVHNQYYELAQNGLRVPQGLARVDRTLRDAEAALDHRFQQEASRDLRALVSEASAHVEVVAHVQSKVEWLEVFFVSYYATALVHYAGDDFFTTSYAHWSGALAPFVSGLIALFGIKPYEIHGLARQGQDSHVPETTSAQKNRKHRSHRSSRWFLIILLILYVVWFLVGVGCCYERPIKVQNAVSTNDHRMSPTEIDEYSDVSYDTKQRSRLSRRPGRQTMNVAG